MHIIYSFLFFIHNLNTTVQDISLGMLASILTTQIGEVVGGEDITGHNIWDAIIKIAIPIITGVIVPIVNNYLNKRKRRTKK